jgi:hypothetical protein
VKRLAVAFAFIVALAVGFIAGSLSQRGETERYAHALRDAQTDLDACVGGGAGGRR